MHPVRLLFDEIYHDHWGIPDRPEGWDRHPDIPRRAGPGEFVRLAAIGWIEHGLEACGHLCLAAARKLNALRSGEISAPPSPVRLVMGH